MQEQYLELIKKNSVGLGCPWKFIQLTKSWLLTIETAHFWKLLRAPGLWHAAQGKPNTVKMKLTHRWYIWIFIYARVIVISVHVYLVLGWYISVMKKLNLLRLSWYIFYWPFSDIHRRQREVCCLVDNVSVLGREEGYTVKYNPLPERVHKGKAWGNSWRQRVIYDCISRVESYYGHYTI